MTTTTITTQAPFVATTRTQAARIAHALLRARTPLALDTETTGLNPRRCKLVAVQLQEQGQRPIVLDCRADPQGMTAPLQAVFAQRGVIGHNLKFDLQFLLAAGLRVDRVFDTLLAEQVWLGLGKAEARARGLGLSLKEVVARYGGAAMSKEERDWFIDLDQRPDEWAAPFPAEQVAYMGTDTQVLWPLFLQLKAQLQRWGLWEAAVLEMRALPAIAGMELRGIRIDLEGWRAFIEGKRVEARAAEDEALRVFGPAILDQRIEQYDRERAAWEAAKAALHAYEEQVRADWEDAGPPRRPWGEWKRACVDAYRATHTLPAKPTLDTTPPNLGSQLQLLAAFDRLGIPRAYKRNERGERVPTTDSDTLEKLAVAHPPVTTLLRYRSAKKFVESFGEALLRYAEEEPGGGVWALHPDYNSIGAGTGRMSCANPNFQQVPHKGDGERLRELVIARPGHLLLTADFSNIELRILADRSGDPAMLELFASGEDLHARTAKLLFKLPAEWGKAETSTHIWRSGQSYRAAAKIVNFLIPYGGSAYALALQNDLPLEDAEALLAGWFAVFGGARAYLDAQAKEVHTTLKSRTVSGRWRRYQDVGPRPERLWKPYDGSVPQGWVRVDRQLTESSDHYQDRLRQWQRAWAAIERQARNAPIQGSSADITKLALALFHARCPQGWGGVVAVVHDELVVEARAEQAPAVKTVLEQAMYDACVRYLPRVTIPWPVAHMGETWYHE